MKLHSQKGFAAVEALLVVIILAILGGTGYYVYQTNKTANNTYSSAAKVAQSEPAKVTKKKSAASTTSTQQYLKITEWGVKLKLSSEISGANYKIITNDIYTSPTAFLSTAALDETAACKSYSQDNPKNPAYQWISRYSPSDMVGIGASDVKISADKAALQYPKAYIKLGNYVYNYERNNGIPCDSQAQLDAFQAAFLTIASS